MAQLVMLWGWREVGGAMNYNEQTSQPFSEVILPLKSAFARYWSLCWAPALAVCGLVLFVGMKLPSYYISDVLISIQQQKLTAKIVEAPSKEDQAERLQALIFEMISRPRLLHIIDQFNLYPEYKGVRGREQALQSLREAIEITPENSTTGVRLTQTFRLSFTHEDQKTSYEVTKAISNLFIDESILSTKGETEGTVEFLDAQLRAARQKLEAMEQQVQNFVRENFGRLPEHLEAGVARLESAQSQLATNSQLITAKTQKMEFLQQELKTTPRDFPVYADGSGGGNSNDPMESLAQLESALVVLRSKYSDEHPDVIAAKSRMQALRGRLGGSGGKNDGKGPRVVGQRASSEARGARREIADLNAELTSLNEENIHLKKSIEQLEKDIKEMPIKEQELIKIRRDYDNTKSNYERLSAAREDAVLQRDLVTSQKGTQFKIVDPPALPMLPAGPPRLIISAAAIGLGLALVLGLPLLFFATNSAFKFRDEVEAELGLSVMGIVPPMETPRAVMQGRKAVSASLAASVISFVAGTVLIFFMV